MLKVLQGNIKTNMAQWTGLFDVSAAVDVQVTSQNNVLTASLADGEWTLSGGIDGIASKGCLNDTYTFTGGQAVTDCFFGDVAEVHSLKAHKVNVGTAFRREAGLQLVTDEKAGNSVVVYLGDATDFRGGYKHSVSEDLDVKVRYSVGVLFRVDASQLEVLGCTDTDKLFISSVLGAKKASSSLIKFESVTDRFYAGQSYVVEYGFSYLDFIAMDSALIERVRNYDATVIFK